MSLLNTLLEKTVDIVTGRKSDKKQNWYNSPDVEEDYGESIEDDIKEIMHENDREEWCYPVDNKVVTSPYGWRMMFGKKSWHNGVDFTGKNKTAYAPCDCIVIKVLDIDKQYPYFFKWDSKQGYVPDESVPSGRAWSPCVVLQSKRNKNYKFSYKHGKPLVFVGDELDAGDNVCEVGNYGYSMGPHLHFECNVDGKDVDPIKFLNEQGAE